MTITEPQHRETHLPGDGHMWFMVLGDLLIFGAYFIVYMVQRAMAPAAYLHAQQHLSITIGVLNTMVLVTSSWFVAQAVRATGSADYGRAIRLIYVCERDHRPRVHGELTFDLANATWLSKHDDPRVQKMAECFLESYLKKNA